MRGHLVDECLWVCWIVYSIPTKGMNGGECPQGADVLHSVAAHVDQCRAHSATVVEVQSSLSCSLSWSQSCHQIMDDGEGVFGVNTCWL